MSNTTMTVSLSVEEKALISACAAELGISASEFVRGVILERIEDELASQRELDEMPGPFERLAREFL